MFDYLYEWIQNIAFYLVIVTALLQVLPERGYKKYVKFFSGMVMILLMLTPLLKLTGMDGRFYDLYHSREYEMEKQEIERQKKYFDSVNILDFLPEEYSPEKYSEEEYSQESDKSEAGQKADGLEEHTSEAGKQADDQKSEKKAIEVEDIQVGQ